MVEVLACNLLPLTSNVNRFKFPGDYCGEATPVTIPNTEVKLSRADDTAGVILWESRSLPGLVFKIRAKEKSLALTFSRGLVLFVSYFVVFVVEKYLTYDRYASGFLLLAALLFIKNHLGLGKIGKTRRKLDLL